MSKFVFTADLHLKKHIWTNRPEIENDTLVSFMQIVDYCVQHKLDLVSGGDNFDNTKPTANLVRFLQDQIAKLNCKGLKFFSVDGNHDKTIPSWLEVVGGISLNEVSYPIGGLWVRGLDHCGDQSELAKKLLSSSKDCDILVCHQLLDLSCKLEGMANMCALDVPKSIKTVLMGDYHVKGKWTNAHGTNFYYPGSIAKLSTSESSYKSFNVVSLVNGNINVSDVGLVTRPYWEYLIEDNSDIALFTSAFRLMLEACSKLSNIYKPYPEITKGVVRILYPAGKSEYVAKVKEIVGSHSHLMFQPIVRDKGVIQEIDTLGNLSPLSVLRGMIHQGDQELYEFCTKFLGTKDQDFRELFNSTRTQYGVVLK